MGSVTPDLAYLAASGLKTQFMAAYNRMSPESVAGRIATVVPTTLPSQDYPWLTSNPTMEKFTGEVIHRILKQGKWTIADETWKAVLDIKRQDLEDDQMGALRIRTQQLAGEAMRHKEELVVTTLALSSTTLCADGQYLVDDDHPESGTNQDNKTTSALSESTLEAGLIAMQQFTDDRGKAMGIRPDTLLVGPKLQFIARRLLESENLITTGEITATTTATVQGSKNVMKGVLNLIVSPYLTGTYDDYWFILDTSRPCRAVILQERSDVPVEFEIPKGDDWYERDMLSCYVRARYNAGNGLWQTVYGGIL